MHVTWWNVFNCLAAICLVLSVISECRSAPREARRLRDLANADGSSHRHSDAFAKQRRKYQREMWWQFPVGLVTFAVGASAVVAGGHWTIDVYSMGVGFWALTSAGVAFRCTRILGPPASTAKR